MPNRSSDPDHGGDSDDDPTRRDFCPFIRYPQAKPAKQLPTDVGAGRVAWFDLSSAKLAASKEFYGKLLGWTFGPVEGTDQAFEIRSRGIAIGTLRGADGAISAFNGVVYIQVDDLTAVARRLRSSAERWCRAFPSTCPMGPARSA